MAENGKRERRLGDEHVARYQLERGARRVEGALVVARDDGALALPFDHDLRCAEDVSGRREPSTDAIDRARHPVGQCVERVGALRPHAHLHDLNGFGRRHDGAMPRPRMVAMTMRDDGAIDRPRRVDEKIAGLAIEPAVSRIEPFVDAGRAHSDLSGDAPNVGTSTSVRQPFLPRRQPSPRGAEMRRGDFGRPANPVGPRIKSRN